MRYYKSYRNILPPLYHRYNRQGIGAFSSQLLLKIALYFAPYSSTLQYIFLLPLLLLLRGVLPVLFRFHLKCCTSTNAYQCMLGVCCLSRNAAVAALKNE